MVRLAPAALAASIACMTLGLGGASAQTRSLAPGAAGAPATLEQFKGIVGDWTGPLGGAAFSAPVAGEIVGHLVLSDGKTPPAARLEELWVFRQEGPTVVMRQKIFGADLKGRQEKDDWEERKVVAAEPGHIYLDNFTISTTGDTAQFVVRTGGQNGAAPGYFTVDMKRVK